MSTEMRMLVCSILLGIIQLIIATNGATRQRGWKWNFSPRDQKVADLTGVAARLDRAFKNFMETFVFFAAAVLLVETMKISTSLSVLGSMVYFFARLIYVPIYAVGTPVIRTVIWTISFVGILMVLSAAF